MRDEAYFYPPRPKDGYDNPYALNFKSALGLKYNVAESDNRPVKGQLLSLVCHAFRSDVFLLNWIENVGVGRKRCLRTWIVLFCLTVMKWRRARIVWVLHNIHPHEGENQWTEAVKRWLFRYAELIITHSKAAAEYAQANTLRKVLFVHHPVTPIHTSVDNNLTVTCTHDVFIWGSIMPYKGVGEFVALPRLHSSGLTVKIIGRCQNPELAAQIASCCGDRISFENRKASFDEIALHVWSSRYVLFPYIDSGFSSSGALIDTLMLGGTPVAPATGAFKDLEEEGLCITYGTQDELFEILNNHSRQVDQEKVRAFMESNSWDRFIDRIYNHLT